MPKRVRHILVPQFVYRGGGVGKEKKIEIERKGWHNNFKTVCEVIYRKQKNHFKKLAYN